MVAIGAAAAKAIETVAAKETLFEEIIDTEAKLDSLNEMAKEIGSNQATDMPDEIVGNQVVDSMPHEVSGAKISNSFKKNIEMMKYFFEADGPYLRKMEERMSPKNGALSGKGEWKIKGELAEFIPESKNAQDALRKFGLEGIFYDKFAEPDFSPIAKETVEIDDMSSIRRGPGKNFEQADTKCAELWNKNGFEGRTDWTPRDVETWRKEYNYSWHERSDMKTMDLVPREVHLECKHFGGCSECKAVEENKGLFMNSQGGMKFDD